ncbi:hypothetical protein [Pseudomonas sp. NPDC089569]|uniref:hypothetical protein n=1 Tax=Pseudomonas sp. NPDC089569 TaxID=3390722 RepID=UPI003D052CD3
MHAKKPEIRYILWIVILLIILSAIFWYTASPVVVVNFSANSKEEFRYIWNTQHRIYKGDIKHGGSAIEFGYIFPDKDFFMMFDWWTDKGFQRCIDITPKWASTIDIYLDITGRIDMSRTPPDTIARLKQCKGQPDPFRP